MKKLITIAAILLFGSCSDSAPEGVLPEDKFVAVMVDLYLVDGKVSYELSQDFDEHEEIHGYYKALFEKHGTSKEELSRSYDHYAKDPAKMQEILARIQQKVNAMRAQTSVPSGPPKPQQEVEADQPEVDK